MRSRDGNRNFSLSIPVILLLCSLALHAREYLISYRYTVKNSILYNESLAISPAMQKCTGEPYSPLFFYGDFSSKDLKKILSRNREEFIDYIHKLGLQVVHKDKTTNFIYQATTILTLKTKCFKVDFNDTFVKISPLK